MPDVMESSSRDEDDGGISLQSEDVYTESYSNEHEEDEDEVLRSRGSSSRTLETSNRRGRSRKRSDRRELRTKFEIESLYNEIKELKKENDALRRIWEDIQRTSDAEHSFSRLYLGGISNPDETQKQQSVPLTVQVSDSGQESDLEMSTSDRDCKENPGCVKQSYDYAAIEEDDEMRIQTLLYS